MAVVAALAALLAAPLPALADAPLDAASAKAFVAGLYTHYAQPFNTTWAYVSPAESGVFDAALVKAMDADSALHPDAPGTSWGDVDVLCMCQEYDKVAATVVVKSLAGGHAKAVATVSVSDSGTSFKSVLNYDLVQVGGAWRVYDVGETGYSFRGAVMSELAKGKHG
jgi:Protein of unknown function (DUF3828)